MVKFRRSAKVTLETYELVLPNFEQMMVLSNFAKVGDFESIVKKLREFEEINKEIMPFANQVHKLAEQFEVNKIYNLIKNSMQKQSDKQKLSKAQTDILLDLAMMGDLDSIVKKLNEFEESNKNIAHFANQIRELAKNFEEERICNLIQHYMEN